MVGQGEQLRKLMWSQQDTSWRQSCGRGVEPTRSFLLLTVAMETWAAMGKRKCFIQFLGIIYLHSIQGQRNWSLLLRMRSIPGTAKMKQKRPWTGNQRNFLNFLNCGSKSWFNLVEFFSVFLFCFVFLPMQCGFQNLSSPYQELSQGPRGQGSEHMEATKELTKQLCSWYWFYFWKTDESSSGSFIAMLKIYESYFFALIHLRVVQHGQGVAEKYTHVWLVRIQFSAPPTVPGITLPI